MKDGLALEFLIEVFVTWKQEKGLASLMTALKKGGLEKRYTLEFYRIAILHATINGQVHLALVGNDFVFEDLRLRLTSPPPPSLIYVFSNTQHLTYSYESN